MKTWRTFLAILTMSAMFAGTAFAAEYNWTFQTSGAAGDDVYRFQQSWAEWVLKDSGGRIQITVLPADAVVKYTETLDAVGANIIQGDLTDPSYFAGKDPDRLVWFELEFKRKFPEFAEWFKKRP